MPLRFGDVIYRESAYLIQIGFTAFAVALLFYLPSSWRVMALENSHRNFHIKMEDVSHAYYASHKADRDSTFKLKSEFDSIRERIAYLNNHPDLAELEPNVMEVAAQMSHVSRDLAETYSDKNVDRARDFLIQRQQEIEAFNERLDTAKSTAVELRKWVQSVEMEEAVAKSQLDRMREELRDILPELWTAELPKVDLPKPEVEVEAEPRPVAVGENAIIGQELNAVDVIPDDPNIVSLLATRKRAQQ